MILEGCLVFVSCPTSLAVVLPPANFKPSTCVPILLNIDQNLVLWQKWWVLLTSQARPPSIFYPSPTITDQLSALGRALSPGCAVISHTV